MNLTDIFERKTYPDGTIYAKIVFKATFENSFNQKVICRINSYEDLMFLAHCKDIYNQHNGNIKILIPCLLEQQADARFSQHESFGLKIFTDFINSLNFLSVTIFHPHSDVSKALLNRSNVLTNADFIRKVLAYPSIDINNLILMSTDAGGFKPLMKLCDEIGWKGETYSAVKSRKYVEEKSELIQVVDRENFQGKDILIIDDMCLYGGTFLGLAKLLKTKNIGKLYLAVSHITVKNPAKNLEIYYDSIFTTNSKYNSYDLENLHVIYSF